MPTVIDFHVHAYPEIPHAEMIEPFRTRAREWMRPFAQSLHAAQTFSRVLPPAFRRAVDEIAALAPLPNLVLESTPRDLESAMEASAVDRAILVAHPPFSSNDFVMDAIAANPKLIAAVNIPASVENPAELLSEYLERGASLLKIHPASDGKGADHEGYHAMLKVADDRGLPVIIHTGCFHSRLYFKDAALGEAPIFAPWFSSYPHVKFVLAHMNFHDPMLAIDLVEEHPNVWVDTSWQPSETIGEAVRRVGSERILFGSDWPIVGNNIQVSLARIRECHEDGSISREDLERILGLNAEKLLGANASSS